MIRLSDMPRSYRRQLQAQDRANVDRAVNESGPIEHTPGATAPGDSRKLRGIPAIGRNVRGAVPGTVPGENLLRPDRIRRLR